MEASTSLLDAFPDDLLGLLACYVADSSLTAIFRLSRTCKIAYNKFGGLSNESKALAYKYVRLGHLSLLKWRASLFSTEKARILKINPFIAGFALGDGEKSISDYLAKKYKIVVHAEVGFWRGAGAAFTRENFASFAPELESHFKAPEFSEKCQETYLRQIIPKCDLKTFKFVLERCAKFKMWTSPGYRSAEFAEKFILDCLKNTNLQFKGSFCDLITHFHEKFEILPTTMILLDLCVRGDLQAFKYGVETCRLPLNPNLNANYFGSRHFDYLKIALTHGHDDIYNYTIAKEPNIPTEVTLTDVFQKGSPDSIRLAVLNLRPPMEKSKLMVLALESANESVWNLCLNQLEGRLTSDCYLSAIRREDKAALKWLHEVKCPFVIGAALKAAAASISSLKFLLEAKSLTLTDKQISTLISPKRIDLVEFMLFEHRKDYKLTSQDLQTVFAANDVDLEQLIAIFKRNGYIWTRQDFLWILMNHDAKYHDNGENLLASAIIAAGYKDLDEELAKLARASQVSGNFAGHYAVKTLKALGCKGLK